MTQCRLHFACRHPKWIHDLGFSERETECDLDEGVSCATFECKVICVSMETGSYAISGSNVVHDLGIQVAHEGSSYVECACGVEMGLTGLDMVSSTGLNT